MHPRDYSPPTSTRNVEPASSRPFLTALSSGRTSGIRKVRYLVDARDPLRAGHAHTPMVPVLCGTAEKNRDPRRPSNVPH